MAENTRRNIPPPDPEAAASCRSGFTRTNSDSSSVTVEGARDSSHQNLILEQDPTTAWTDEKHSSYLNFLEAKFVEELNDSMCLRNFSSQKNRWGPYSARYSPADVCNPSDQFVVVQDGRWKKMKFDGNSQLVEKATNSHVRLESPWMHHFKSAGTNRYLKCNTQEHGVLSSERVPSGRNSFFSSGSASSGHYSICNLCHCDSIGSNQEFSDQNFSEEGCGQSSSCESIAKRLKKASVDTSNKDQVVPSRNFHVTDISKSGNASLKRGEPKSENFLLSNAENSSCHWRKYDKV